MLTVDEAWNKILRNDEPMDDTIRSIQLDAMKEGMRRAAKIAPTEEQLAANHGDTGEQRIGVIDYKDRILAAAVWWPERFECMDGH